MELSSSAFSTICSMKLIIWCTAGMIVLVMSVRRVARLQRGPWPPRDAIVVSIELLKQVAAVGDLEEVGRVSVHAISSVTNGDSTALVCHSVTHANWTTTSVGVSHRLTTPRKWKRPVSPASERVKGT